jgi:ubiquinone/menaquinone biosynthesis C-methylase UbiE
MTRPPFSLDAVNAATADIMTRGHRVLQTHMYGSDEFNHVAYLLDIMAPPEGAIVFDAGCGIGEVSRLMSEMRPDLRFILANLSVFQLSLCPTGAQYRPLHCDLHETGLASGSVDVAMYSSTLCQLDHAVALDEAYRILKPGGVLFINDMERGIDDGGTMEQSLAARVLPAHALIKLVKSSGFTIDKAFMPKYNDEFFRGLLRDSGMESYLDGIKPIVIRAIK